MKAIFVISLLVAVVAASNWSTNDRNNRKMTERDGKHQKFVIDLLRHLQQDIFHKDFLRYSQTIRIDNKNDYKDLNKVYYMMTLYRNGWFVERGKPFSMMRERNIITTKALFDFFDTMTDWNTCAMNLIWCRRNINEYQFWHLMTLLVTHNRHLNNIVLPTMYEVFPNQFFTGDVMDQAVNVRLNLDNIKTNKLVIMSNYTTGVLGSNDDDDNGNVYDLNDIKNGKNKINDWNTLKLVMNDIKNQMRRTTDKNNQLTHRKNKDIKNKIQNNNRNLNQGNKFDNNGEDRLVYFTEDIGLNNWYYFSRMANSRIVDKKQMFNNMNNKETFNMRNGKTFNKGEFNDKINRRGERYLYKMMQLLARFNLERKCNGLDNVKDVTLDGTVNNGVYPNLRYTNGLQMPNRQNDFNLKKQHNMRLIQVTKDFENRFYRAIDQGFVLTETGRRVDLQNKNGINILGNLLQGNRDSVNKQFYRYLEYYYRLLLGGNNHDNVDFEDNRFVPTVLDHYETSMRDPVFWQIVKRITNIVDKFKNKLIGYKTHEVDFNGVKINNVKVDKLVTTFNYFDCDITNGINMDMNERLMCKDNRKRGGNTMTGSGSNESGSGSNSVSGSSSSSSSSESGSDSNESGNIGRNKNRNGMRMNRNGKRMNRNGGRNGSSGSSSSSSESVSNSRSNESTSRNMGKRLGRNNRRFNRVKNYNNRFGTASDSDYHGRNTKLYNRNNKSSESDSNDSNSSTNESMGRRNGHYRNGQRNMRYNRMNRGYSGERGHFKRFMHQGISKQVNYWKRTGNYNGNMNTWKCNILGRTRRMDTKQFTVTIDVQSNKNQNGIVRIFLGPRINNKQQLNDNRHNFVELDQFICKLNQGQNVIKRNSRDFKNVVGDGLTMNMLYNRALNTMNKKTNGNDLNNVNFDTNNNNRGYPHRLLLPKGTVGGEDYTLFIVVNDVNNQNDQVRFGDRLNTRGIGFGGVHMNKNRDSSESNSSNGSGDSNGSSNSNSDSSSSSSGSNESNNCSGGKNCNGSIGNRKGKNMGRNMGRNTMNHKNFNRNSINHNDYNVYRYGNNVNRNGNGNFGNKNGVMIHNNNNGNKNIGNGNGVLGTRAMGFPLDRQIIDITGFVCNNMFFKDVTIFHVDNSNYNRGNDY